MDRLLSTSAKELATSGFDPPTSGLWAQHASLRHAADELNILGELSKHAQNITYKKMTEGCAWRSGIYRRYDP